MDLKSYSIPRSCQTYSREPRPYRPRPPAQRTAPRKPAVKVYFLKSTVPKVSKLKPLTRYGGIKITPLAKPVYRPVVAASKQPAAQRPVADHDLRTATAIGRDAQAARRQAQYEVEQRRRQTEHARQQEAIQRDHQRRMELERRRQQEAAQRENKRRDRARANENRRAAPDRRARHAEAEEDEHELEPEFRTSQAPRRSESPAETRERLKQEIRRKLAAGLNDGDKEEESAAKSSSCGGNVVFFLIVGTILYFAFCSGIIEELLG